jgi:hypothetical protein
MNYIISVFALIAVITSNPAQAVDNHAAADSAKAQHQTKRVCVDQTKDGKPIKDAKGNTKQTCKEVKQHKKLEVETK